MQKEEIPQSTVPHELITVSESFITGLLVRAIMLLAGFGVFFLGCVFWYFDARFQIIEAEVSKHIEDAPSKMEVIENKADIALEEIRLSALENRVNANYADNKVILTKLTYIEDWIRETRKKENAGE